MLDEQVATAGLQDAAHLGEGRLRIGDRAERPGRDHAVETPLLEIPVMLSSVLSATDRPANLMNSAADLRGLRTASAAIADDFSKRVLRKLAEGPELAATREEVTPGHRASGDAAFVWREAPVALAQHALECGP